MPFWKCYYHVVWATHNREPWITPEIETIIFRTIQSKSQLLGCPVLTINGIADHIHVAVNIPPKVAPAEWARNVKGFSAHEVNASFPNLLTTFRWQTSYGLLTFGEKTLPFITDYIVHQKERHAAKLLEPYLERTED